MFQVVYKYPSSWPEAGPLRVDLQFTGEIVTSPEVAQRRANGYLGCNVALFIVADKPMLVVGDRPVWRVPTSLELRELGKVASVGSIDIDAVTGEVVPLSESQIAEMRERAKHVATRLTLAATPAV